MKWIFTFILIIVLPLTIYFSSDFWKTRVGNSLYYKDITLVYKKDYDKELSNFPLFIYYPMISADAASFSLVSSWSAPVTVSWALELYPIVYDKNSIFLNGSRITWYDRATFDHINYWIYADKNWVYQLDGQLYKLEWMKRENLRFLKEMNMSYSPYYFTDWNSVYFLTWKWKFIDTKVSPTYFTLFSW